jgi:hypothetical protein
MATDIPLGNYLLTGAITTATANFEVTFKKSGTNAIVLNFVPAELAVTLSVLEGDGTTVKKIYESGTSLVVDLQKFWIYIFGSQLSVVFSNNAGPPVLSYEVLSVECTGLIDQLDQVVLPSALIVPTQTSYTDAAAFETDFGALISTAFLTYWNQMYIENATPASTPNTPIAICPQDDWDFMTTTSWIVTGILIGVAVLFIILFGLSMGKVIKADNTPSVSPEQSPKPGNPNASAASSAAMFY